MKERKKNGPQVTDVSQIYRAGYRNLDTGAKVIYRARCKDLLDRKELFFSDLAELVLYAHSCSLYWKFYQIVKDKGELLEYTDMKGNVRYYANPAVKMCRDALNDISAIGARFGFEPLSRKKLAQELATEDDPIEAFLQLASGRNDRKRTARNN